MNIIGSKPKKNSNLINRLSFRHKKGKNKHKQPEPVIKTTTTTYTIQTTTTITIQEASDDEDGSINEHKLDDTQVDVDAFEKQNESQTETNNDTNTNSNLEDKTQDFTNSSNAKELKNTTEKLQTKENPVSTWISYSDLFESMDSVFNSMTMLTKDSLDKTLLELDSTFLDANEDTIEKLKSNTFETFGEYDEDYEFYEYDLASLNDNEPDQLYKELLDAELNSGENYEKLYADVDGLNKKQCKIKNTHENINSDSDSRHFKIDNYYLSQSLKEIKENFDFKNQYSLNINKQFNSADLFLYKNFNSYLCLNNSIEYLFSPFITNADSIYEIARIIANNSRNSN